MPNKIKKSAFFSFESRICDFYRESLLLTLDEFIFTKGKITKSKLLELKKLLLPTNENDKKYKRKFKGGENLTHCLRIDFCGLASSTLLNSNVLEGDKNHELTEEIAERFEKLVSESNCKDLNSKGIYVKIRFLFAYLYSEFPFSLMKAEKERKRPKVDDFRLIYDFENEPGLTKGQFINSTICKSQCDSINKLLELYKGNALLKRTLHHRSLNTLQVRFTPIPIPFCMLIYNKNAYTDSYIYAKLRGKNQLSTRYPLLQVNKSKNSIHFDNINNHFDYLWHHDLTLILEDCIKIPKDKEEVTYENILLPHDVTWRNKKNIIKDYLLHFEKKVPKKEYSLDKQRKWEQIIKNRFLKSSKLPFSTKEEITKHKVSVIFTDFVRYSDISNKTETDILVNNLYDCFNKFDEICKEHNVLKIKTIGDAYMCVVGLPPEISGLSDIKDFQHANTAIKVAKEMMTKFNEIKKIKRFDYFEGIRIGINSGLVAARRYQTEIDIFGSTVNLAARMEQNSLPNQIKISDKTYIELEKENRLKKTHFEPVKLKLAEFSDEIMTYNLIMQNKAAHKKIKRDKKKKDFVR